ncbi:MAG TPA: hypothetical protein DC038_03640 [Clostridiales bacterium]|nr:hypothetical protein [Clostridiales bacterium]
MEDLMKEILHELKEIKKEIKGSGTSNLKTVNVKITMDEDEIINDVIKSINAKNMASKDAAIVV